jgi:hypothetical protein
MSPETAKDPSVNVMSDPATSTFTITAKNSSGVVCHQLDLHVLGEAGYNPDPSTELRVGLSDGKLTTYRDVAPGQTVSQTLEAKAIRQALPAGQVFRVGAVGYCMDSRR